MDPSLVFVTRFAQDRFASSVIPMMPLLVNTKRIHSKTQFFERILGKPCILFMNLQLISSDVISTLQWTHLNIAHLKP